MPALDFVRAINSASLWENRGDPVDLVRARDRAVRAALLEELADEEHESAWEAAIEHRWRVDLGAPHDALRETCHDYHEARRRERVLRRRAAAERGDDHG